MRPADEGVGRVAWRHRRKRRNMRALAPSLPLRDEIRRALEAEAVPECAPLCWLEAYERGQWNSCDSIAEQRKLAQHDLYLCYEEALGWAEKVLHFA